MEAVCLFYALSSFTACAYEHIANRDLILLSFFLKLPPFLVVRAFAPRLFATTAAAAAASYSALYQLRKIRYNFSSST